MANKTIGQVISAFDKVHSLSVGRHSVIIEFSDAFEKLDKETGKPIEKNGCVVKYRKVAFYDVEDKTKLVDDDRITLSDGQLHFLFKSLDRMVEALEGKSEKYMMQYVAKNPVDIYVKKDPKFGKQYNAYPERA